MRAMVLETVGQPLTWKEVPAPAPAAGELLLRIAACAVCRTDLHILKGELPSPKLPLILGHEMVGRVEKLGPGTSGFSPGDLVGVPWLGWTCSVCDFCRSGRENLCERALFTGYTRDGGYAEYAVADARFCLKIPPTYSPPEAAPLLCAGLIGYRSLSKTGDARNLGIFGFGAAAHIITQVAAYQKRNVFAFTRNGDAGTQQFARSLGAAWAGGTAERPPAALDAAILFAPAGELVPLSLKLLRKGGLVVCGGIHMTDIPSFPYDLLWGERTVCSVANLTRKDGQDFMELAPKIPVRTSITVFPLQQANQALSQLDRGALHGAAVLIPDGSP